MRKWFQSFVIIAFLFPCYLLASCSMEESRSGIETSNEQSVESITASVDSSEAPSSSVPRPRRNGSHRTAGWGKCPNAGPESDGLPPPG